MTDHTAFCSEPLLLRFDSYEGRVAKGTMQTLRYQMPFYFDSLDQLFMLMEDALDEAEFPRKIGEFRHLKMEKGKTGYSKAENRGWRWISWKQASRSPEDGDGRRETGAGFRGQMTVTVHRREYGSIQGTVNVKGEKTQFRSALELMHMLHEYLENNFRHRS
ncbi:MAG: hypothetical protein HFI68_03180 [Lachnospiraceae bacterium]|nr:hypothetical protein [Lachnospiraceae bacterium]